MMPPLEMMSSAPDLFMLVISEPCTIKTTLISLQIGNCDICVFNALQGGLHQRKKKGNCEASILHNSPSDERVTSYSSTHMFWSREISIVVETFCSKYHGLLAVRLKVCCVSVWASGQAGWLGVWLVDMQADSPALLPVRKTTVTLQKAFHPVELPSVKLAKPSWLIPQSLDDVWFKSTSLLLAQRKQALHTNATSSASLWWSWMGISLGVACWRATVKWKRTTVLFSCGLDQIKTADSAKNWIQKNTQLCKCVYPQHTHLRIQPPPNSNPSPDVGVSLFSTSPVYISPSVI